MRFDVFATNKYLRDVKKAKARGLDIERLLVVVDLLATGEPLSPQYKDHALTGNLRGLRDCHIAPDWLLIYSKEETIRLLTLHRTGTHADIFK